MSKNTTKRSLLASVFALVLCVAMLVGSTFAWFTDTATTGVNKITSGKLDVKLSYAKGKNCTEWAEVKNTTKLFDDGALWEPGHTEVAYLKVENVGNLALKYQLSVNVANEVSGTNVNGDTIKLSNYIKMGVVENRSTSFADRNAARAAVTDAGNIATYTKTGSIAANDTNAQYVALVVYMPETVGNEANYVGDTAPSIDLGVKLAATQYTEESDSFDDQYDKDATYPVTSAAELKSAVANSGKFNVTEDIDVNETLNVKNVGVVLNAAGKKISNSSDIWDEVNGNWSLVSARGANGTSLVIKDGNFEAKANDCFTVDVQDGACVTIENGTFVGNVHAVYVFKGTAYIKGGFYSIQQKYPDASKADEFVLNCYDANRAAGTAKIIVTGGTFVNFNPADCQAEGAHTNFVADGYKVVSEKQANGDTWYTVVPA